MVKFNEVTKALGDYAKEEQKNSQDYNEKKGPRYVSKHENTNNENSWGHFYGKTSQSLFTQVAVARHPLSNPGDRIIIPPEEYKELQEATNVSEEIGKKINSEGKKAVGFTVKPYHINDRSHTNYEFHSRYRRGDECSSKNQVNALSSVAFDRGLAEVGDLKIEISPATRVKRGQAMLDLFEMSGAENIDGSLKTCSLGAILDPQKGGIADGAGDFREALKEGMIARSEESTGQALTGDTLLNEFPELKKSGSGEKMIRQCAQAAARFNQAYPKKETEQELAPPTQDVGGAEKLAGVSSETQAVLKALSVDAMENITNAVQGMKIEDRSHELTEGRASALAAFAIPSTNDRASCQNSRA